MNIWQRVLFSALFKDFIKTNNLDFGLTWYLYTSDYLMRVKNVVLLTDIFTVPPCPSCHQQFISLSYSDG